MRSSFFMLLCTAAIAAGFVTGWRRGGAAAEGPHSPLPATAAVTPMTARASDWLSHWQNARPAERDVLLQSWIARDPRAALHFLLKLPPGSFAGQKELQRVAL